MVANFLTLDRCRPNTCDFVAQLYQLCMSHTATVSHKQALTEIIDNFLFMRQSRGVLHAQLRTCTLQLSTR